MYELVVNSSSSRVGFVLVTPCDEIYGNVGSAAAGAPTAQHSLVAPRGYRRSTLQHAGYMRNVKKSGMGRWATTVAMSRDVF
jgi:hypothetical protein